MLITNYYLYQRQNMSSFLISENSTSVHNIGHIERHLYETTIGHIESHLYETTM